jgi:hypothetical protein
MLYFVYGKMQKGFVRNDRRGNTVMDLKTPFSTYGSYFTVSVINNEILIRNISGNAEAKDILSIRAEDDRGPVALEPGREGALLRLTAGQQAVEVCFEGDSCVRFRGTSLSLRFSSSAVRYGCCCELRPDRWLLSKFESRVSFVLDALKGNLQIANRWDGANCKTYDAAIQCEADGAFELAVELYRAAATAETGHSLTFCQCADKANRAFSEFLQKTVVLPPELNRVREEAAYLNWSSVAAPEGFINALPCI